MESTPINKILSWNDFLAYVNDAIDRGLDEEIMNLTAVMTMNDEFDRSVDNE